MDFFLSSLKGEDRPGEMAQWLKHLSVSVSTGVWIQSHPKVLMLSCVLNLKGQHGGLLNSSIVQGKTHYSERKAEIGMIEGETEGRGGRKKAGLHSIVCCYTAMKTKSSQETRGLERCFHQPGGRKTNPGSICVLLYSRQWPFLEGFCFQGLPRKLQY